MIPSVPLRFGSLDPFPQSNQMQVEVQLSVHRSLIILPVGHPGYETYSPLPGQSPQDVSLGGCVVLSAPELEVQLRSHSLGLEMNLNSGTIYGEVESDYTERSIFTRSQWYPTSEVFVIEGRPALFRWDNFSC